MAGKVILTIQDGRWDGEEYVFNDRTICTVGRAEDCCLRPPNELSFLEVSRHHCLLDIDPPEIRVRDMGSRNGTFVNGTTIGQRAPGQPPEDFSALDMADHSLHDGDVLQVGSIVFRVKIVDSADSNALPTHAEQEAVVA
ncbi:MAG: FHA domain-containing protein [Planctomycetes bacterium]|nr:FHA domain-containing protein [Planctomycetota bacterium]